MIFARRQMIFARRQIIFKMAKSYMLRGKYDLLRDKAYLLRGKAYMLRGKAYLRSSEDPRVGAVKPGFFINFGRSAPDRFGATKPVMSLQTSNYL